MVGDVVTSLSTNVSVQNQIISPDPTAQTEVYLFQDTQTVNISKSSLKATNQSAKPGGSDTFDLSGIGQALNIAIKKSDVVVGNGSTDFITASGDYRPANIIASSSDDTVTIEKSGKLKGTINAGTGNKDVLNYSGTSKYGGKVRVNLDAQSATERNPQTDKNQTIGGLSATGINNNDGAGIAGFEIVIGGKSSDNLYGFNSEDNRIAGASGSDFIVGGSGDDVLVGGGLGDQSLIDALRNVSIASPSAAHITTLEDTTQIPLLSRDKDVLMGKGGADLLIGGPNDDHLYGGADNDKLYGGLGDDSFYFENGWGVDQLADATWNDKLDFSAVTAALEISLASTGYTIAAGANRVENVAAKTVTGTSASQALEHNVTVTSLPTEPTTLGGIDFNTTTYKLDLSQVAVDLNIAIDKLQGSPASKVTITSNSDAGIRLQIFGVTEVIGGRGQQSLPHAEWR